VENDVPLEPEEWEELPELEEGEFETAADVEAAKPQRTWTLFALLFVASLMASAVMVPFSVSLIKQMRAPRIPVNILPQIFVLTLLIEGVFSAVTIALGLWLGGRVGLGVPLLRDWLNGDPESAKQIRSSLGLGIVMGLGLGLLFLVVPMVSGAEKLPNKLVLPPLWEGFLASIGAGVREELWFRLGFMTFFVWLGAVMLGQETPRLGVVWTSNLLAALLFAAIHLPQTDALLGRSANLFIFVLVGNGVPGLVFGWLYWRRNLFAAMAAHTSLDIVLKVILPALHRG